MDVILLIAILVTSVLAGGQLLRRAGGHLRLPILTLAIAAVTLVVSVVGELVPDVLDALGRDRDALAAGEWWRIVTPLFVQDGGWPGLVSNLVALLLLGTLVESLLGRAVLAITYFAAGLISEVFAYTLLQGQGFAGNSVANFGLAGLLAIVAVAGSERSVATTALARIFGAVSLAAGVWLAAIANLHAVGFVVGVAVGATLLLAGAKAVVTPPATPPAPAPAKAPSPPS